MKLGQGATQAMEDVGVMAAVLSHVSSVEQDHSEDYSTSKSMQSRIEAAFTAWELVRRARFEAVAKTSLEAMDFWSDFFRVDITQKDVQEFIKATDRRFEWIWNTDVAGQHERAVAEMRRLLYTSESLMGRVNDKAR